MTLQDIEQLLTTRRLEIYEKRIAEAGASPLDNEQKFAVLMVECDRHYNNATRCLRVLAGNDLSGLDEFGMKRIIEAFAFTVDIHLNTALILLREALKFAPTDKDRDAVGKMIEQCQKKQQGMRGTFDEALQGFREDYTALLGNEQVYLDAAIKFELGDYF